MLPSQKVENYEYELPSDFEDEEIDEDMAFTAEDKKLYAGWFGDGGSDEEHAAKGGRKMKAEFADLESSEEEGSEQEGSELEVSSSLVWGWRPPQRSVRLAAAAAPRTLLGLQHEKQLVERPCANFDAPSGRLFSFLPLSARFSKKQIFVLLHPSLVSCFTTVFSPHVKKHIASLIGLRVQAHGDYELYFFMLMPYTHPGASNICFLG